MNIDYKTLLKLFFNLCLIKVGPKDVPESNSVLRVVFVAYFLSGTVLISSEAVLFEAAVQAFIEAVLVGLFVYGLVNFFSVPQRFNQSIIAIYGSGAFITTASIPFIFWMQSLVNNEQTTGVVGLVVFLIVCWSFMVMAYIIRETIQKSLTTSLLLTFSYLYLSYQLVNTLYPIEGG